MLKYRLVVVSTLLGFVMTLSAQNTPVDAFPPTGGMWLPSQMPELEAQLRELGLEIDPQELADPTSNTLEAIVSLDGCSGSFVSKDGLIITNHHCVESYLSYMTEQDKAALKAQNAEREKEGLPTIEADVECLVSQLSPGIWVAQNSLFEEVPTWSLDLTFYALPTLFMPTASRTMAPEAAF